MNLSMRTVLMVGIALIAAAGTALFARSWLNAERAAMAGRNTEFVNQILVAKADMSAGSFVRAPDLRWQGWPKGTLAPTYVLRDGKNKPEQFVGAVVRYGLVAGQPITDALVVRPGEQGFLAAVLDPGMRAVSVQVDASSGVSGFIFPGDRVDMILTHTVRGPSNSRPRHVSETVLRDLRVLAVDQKVEDLKDKPKASVAKTVTLEVTPKQVEKVWIMTKVGRISLSLRPIAREDGDKEGAPVMATANPPATDTMATAAKAMPEPAAAAKATPKPTTSAPTRRDRGGLTIDSEVSRMLGHNGNSGRSVKVVRGGKKSKTEDQSY